MNFILSNLTTTGFESNHLVHKRTLNHLAKLVWMIKVCCWNIFVLCIWGCVFIMSHSRFTVNLHYGAAWMSRSSWLLSEALHYHSTTSLKFLEWYSFKPTVWMPKKKIFWWQEKIMKNPHYMGNIIHEKWFSNDDCNWIIKVWSLTQFYKKVVLAYCCWRSR